MYFILILMIIIDIPVFIYGSTECNILKRCIPKPTKYWPIFPSNTTEINQICEIYENVTSCIEEWSEECLETSGSAMVVKQVDAMDAFVYLLCLNEKFVTEYMRESKTFKDTREGMQICIENFQSAYFESKSHKETVYQLCCAWYKFNRCIITSCTDRCTISAAIVLRRILSRISEDVFAKKCDDFYLEECPNYFPEGKTDYYK